MSYTDPRNIVINPASSSRNIIQPSGDFKALIVKNNASQTANPFEIQTSAGVNIFQVGATGLVGVNISGTAALAAKALSTNDIFAGYDSSGNLGVQFPTGTTVGWITLTGPSGQGAGSGITFRSNGGSPIGSFSLDLSGNMVFRNSTSGDMYFDYFNGMFFRRGASSFATFASVDATGTWSMQTRDAVTAAVTRSMTLRHNTSGTAAAGFGNELRFQLESSTTEDTDASGIVTSWVVATHASRTARLVINVYDATATREGIRVEADGTQPLIGFLGASAVARQTNASQVGINAVADASAKAALQAIYTLLVNLGLANATA